MTEETKRVRKTSFLKFWHFQLFGVRVGVHTIGKNMKEEKPENNES